ncbi:MAG: hypothetical protein M3Y91_13960, partial [Actinomycetota bacterium]|nr:hypothetical protein [Actinomycetota bacterium]
QTAARRDLADERRWQADTGRDADPSLDERSAQVERRAATRDRWMANNGTRLARWDALGHAIDQGEDLLAHARSLSPAPEAHRDVKTGLAMTEPAPDAALGLGLG